ncbi:lysine-specific demethylase hairless isoform X1 [Falco peregrinus]|uniref:lysine-specific demethylase hairless isoform X1 n=1 Tax=Falco peregrinus TaxID=8954 RepID=UPI002478924C|nr:lysine-specific demethylase hairless isoform X1 [Falco peregrinus]XP_055676326.1 lysine-specific demethylase hairless isoform X1 [Falco peregrinus]XP_055676327.1 lysine-specific demethylase hairless isoform X1 [Falco peregrinus]
MASDTKMGETAQRWRRAQDTAQDTQGMESSGMVLPRSTAAELGLPGYPEPGKLNYGTEKGCPWRGSEGCLGPGRELAGGQLGCPYPLAPPCLQDALCRPKDGAELPPLLPPRNGQPKAGWAEPCKERTGPRWAEAVLAPLALYSHAYHRYPLAFPGLDTQCPSTTGKPRVAAGDGAGDPLSFRHCPFLVEAKHSPFLLSSLLPTGPPADPPFGGSGPEGPGTMGDGRFAGVDWRLGSYAPTWAQPLYLGLPPRCKAAPAPFDGCSSSGKKEFYPKKEPGFHPPAKDQAPSQPLGKSQAGQDGDREGELAVPELPGAPWRDGRAGGSSVVPTPHAHTPPPSASHPLFLLQPGAAGGCRGPWLGTGPHTADFPLEPGPGRPSEPKDKHLAYQSHQPSSPLGPGEPDPSSPLVDGRYPPALAKPEPPPACLCTTSGCEGCPGVGCEALGSFEPTLGIPGGHFPCPPSNHTKLKKTWLTRHSEQSLPRCKAPRRDGGSEAAGEGKRSAKRPHGTADGPCAASEGARAAKRGTKATEHMAMVCPGEGTESRGDPEERRMELGEGDPPSHAGPEPWCLQSVPCTALPESIPRCCACAARAVGHPEAEEEEEEDSPESTCRLLHFRRFAFGDGGELSVDGFFTLGEAEGEMLQLEAAGPERGSRSAGSSLCLAKYLLGVLGDPFCEAVRRDRDTWPGGPGRPEGVTAWRRREGAPQLCDACQRSFFNSHWSCTRCGFQLCPDCHRSRREADSHEDLVWLPECIPGQDHPLASLIPTQFIPTCVLTRLWKLLHEVRVKFSIESHCPCREGAGEHSLAEPPGSRQELPGVAVPILPPSSDAQADTSQPIKEAESPEGGPPSPGQPPPRGAVQTTTLCDLLASTAVKLCLGQDGVRMAFAPVSPALPSDNRLTSILDSIIARVVERKIQERQAGGELSPPGPPASHCILAPSGLLWLHDPSHTSNYKLFQEHWRQGQPVLVSGLQKRLEGRLWGPESFRPARGEQAVEAVNLRVPASRVRMSSQEFWDGFTASAASPEMEQGGGDLLKLESGFGDMELCRAANLSASLPLPEYCGPTGRLNLATYLRGQQGRRWLRPRVCMAYGVQPQDRTIGTKNLMVEAADSISILVHAAARLPARQDMLLQADADGVDALLKERLWDAGSRPGALWHIFRAEDAGRIQDFLQKTREDQGQEGTATAEPPGCYLDLSLRRRLREECGVSGWTLLQFLGDAVLVPAGAPHQVQTLTSIISVEQRFLSPENATRLRHHSTDPLGAARQLRAQLDGMIFSAVREAVGVLRGCK